MNRYGHSLRKFLAEDGGWGVPSRDSNQQLLGSFGQGLSARGARAPRGWMPGDAWASSTSSTGRDMKT